MLGNGDVMKEGKHKRKKEGGAVSGKGRKEKERKKEYIIKSRFNELHAGDKRKYRRNMARDGKIF